MVSWRSSVDPPALRVLVQGDHGRDAGRGRPLLATATLILVRRPGRDFSAGCFLGCGRAAPDPDRGRRRGHAGLPGGEHRGGRVPCGEREQRRGGAARDRGEAAEPGAARPRAGGGQRPGPARPSAWQADDGSVRRLREPPRPADHAAPHDPRREGRCRRAAQVRTRPLAVRRVGLQAQGIQVALSDGRVQARLRLDQGFTHPPADPA